MALKGLKIAQRKESLYLNLTTIVILAIFCTALKYSCVAFYTIQKNPFSAIINFLYMRPRKLLEKESTKKYFFAILPIFVSGMPLIYI